MQIPQNGLSKEEVFAALQSYKAYDMDWKSGKVWAYVYNPGDETMQVITQAYNLFLTENGLDPSVFPSMLKLETDVVRMLANLLRGDEQVVGHVTTGGTESIMLAVKTLAAAEEHDVTLVFEGDVVAGDVSTDVKATK